MSMPLVRIVKNWSWPSLLRQSPTGDGVWNGIRFTDEPVAESDYVIVSNGTFEPVEVCCPPEHVWAIMQEPPNELYRKMHRGQPSFRRIYTTDPSLPGPRYIQSQPAIAWHVNKSYQELVKSSIPEKSRSLSWITSNLRVFRGHSVRLKFLKKIRSRVQFDLYGRGFNPIADKWDGLSPYHYALAIENFVNPYYWSEKLSDCFLAWTMPIYYGCTHITDYFPAESMIRIDIHAPDVVEQINEAVASAPRQHHLDAIAEARRRVLECYQLLPFFAEKIVEHQQTTACLQTHRPQPVRILSLKQMHQLPWTYRGLVFGPAKKLLNRLAKLVSRRA